MKRSSSIRMALAAATALSTLPAGAQEVGKTSAQSPTAFPTASPGASSPATSLEDQFRDPPISARPRVWWHWMNGNITKDGIAKDLAG